MRLNRIFLAGILGHMLCCSLAMTAQQKAAFSYSGDTGPGFWGEINSACAGSPTSRQSPIDIHDAEEDPRLIPLDVVLGETSFTLTNPGYTVLATPETAGILASL